MELNLKQDEVIDRYFTEAVAWRRQLHRCPQPAWLEYYATGLVAEKLTEWGYTVSLGKDVVDSEKLILSPTTEKHNEEFQRALQFGVKEKFITPAKGGLTGVVGVLKGSQPGPTIGFRFDIDSNEVCEASDPGHRPAREGFASQNPGYAHMCGHDVHTAMGLLLARYFAENREAVKGTIKFIFQPNEENLSGAAAMVSAGVVDDLDYLFSGHVGINVKRTGQIALNVNNFYALSRFEVTYRGRASHAALRPDEGMNALLGACAAVTNLYAIARHGTGASRINVGTMTAGTDWNVIPDRASFKLETRGVTDEINNYMVTKVHEVLKGAAVMYGLELEIKPGAVSCGGSNSPELVAISSKVAQVLPSVKEVVAEASLNASEDVTAMMERVQSRGGKAMYVLFGTPVAGGHHNAAFDVDENVIANGAKFLASVYKEIMNG
ncbi:amidohydrolase [Sporomusa sp.]|uniref:amidohydrolase n=1 Tax=Sporomusa sp. TaxID=2078658 RepID=UPI002C5704DD|nr:amidohydrolase [Sporomusa sp.]HWR45750.1 amidohydrolase [Sporomusa sp.]